MLHAWCVRQAEQVFRIQAYLCGPIRMRPVAKHAHNYLADLCSGDGPLDNFLSLLLQGLFE
jgi:hypothetical protein